jgi:hypothetical protein
VFHVEHEGMFHVEQTGYRVKAVLMRMFHVEHWRKAIERWGEP